MLTQIEEYLNEEMQPYLEDFLNDAESFKFNFRPVLFNPEKRGHLYTNSLFSHLQKQNQDEENYEDQVDISYAVQCMTEELNNLLENSPRDASEHVLNKISHFTENNGVISCYLSDKQTIEELVESTKEIINSDDDLTQKSTDISDFSHEESTETVKEDVSGNNTCSIGVVESVFREVHGVPTHLGFIPKALAKIHLNGSKLDTISKNIGDSRYIWIQHIFQNRCDCQEQTDDNEYVENSRDSIKTVNSQMTWSLAQVENFTDKTIWISGARILHNTPIFDLCSFKSESVLESFKTNPLTCSFNSKIVKKMVQNNNTDYSQEDLVNEEIEKYSTKMKCINYTESVMKDLTNIANQDKLDFYSSNDEIISAINLVLSMEPVSLSTQTKNTQKNISAIAFDNLMIIYEKVGETITVFKIIWSTHFIETGSHHSKKWLDSLCQILDLEQLA